MKFIIAVFLLGALTSYVCLGCLFWIPMVKKYKVKFFKPYADYTTIIPLKVFLGSLEEGNDSSVNVFGTFYVLNQDMFK